MAAQQQKLTGLTPPEDNILSSSRSDRTQGSCRIDKSIHGSAELLPFSRELSRGKNESKHSHLGRFISRRRLIIIHQKPYHSASSALEIIPGVDRRRKSIISALEIWVRKT